MPSGKISWTKSSLALLIMLEEDLCGPILMSLDSVMNFSQVVLTMGSRHLNTGSYGASRHAHSCDSASTNLGVGAILGWYST